jgi:hypothetical protein
MEAMTYGALICALIGSLATASWYGAAAGAVVGLYIGATS